MKTKAGKLADFLNEVKDEDAEITMLCWLQEQPTLAFLIETTDLDTKEKAKEIILTDSEEFMEERFDDNDCSIEIIKRVEL